MRHKADICKCKYLQAIFLAPNADAHRESQEEIRETTMSRRTNKQNTNGFPSKNSFERKNLISFMTFFVFPDFVHDAQTSYVAVQNSWTFAYYM